MRVAGLLRAAFSAPCTWRLPSKSFTAPCTPVTSYALPYVARRSLRVTATTQLSNSTPQTPQTPQTSSTSKPPKNSHKLTLLYDGECPLCVKEVAFLRKRSESRSNPLGFVDIAQPEYSPSQNAGISYETAMGRIHAIGDKGQVITGVKVFRDAYSAIGLGWVYAITQLPGIGWAAERLYDIWADKRMQLTGRPPLEQIMFAREKKTCR